MIRPVRVKRSHGTCGAVLLCAMALTSWCLLGACRPQGDPDAPAASDHLVPGRQNVTLEHGGLERTALVYRPANLPEGPVPLVLLFHGAFGSAMGALETYELERWADARGFIVAAPEGTGTVRTWNAGACCGAARDDGVDDVGFVRALVERLSRMADIDPERIVATGMSNGAALCYRLACEAPDLIRAIAPVAGSQVVPACQPSQPVSVLHIHGRLDQHVPIDGGIGEHAVAEVQWPPVEQQFQDWQGRDGCTGAVEVVRDEPRVQCRANRTCAQGTRVELCIVEDLGHEWPPTDQVPNEPTSDALQATEVIVDFLLQ
jgi:polyhydroxybutyrate depolymerase